MITMLDFWHNLPVVLLAGAGVLALFVEATQKDSADAAFWLALAALVGSVLFELAMFMPVHISMNNMIQNGGYASVLVVIICSAAFIAILMTRDYFKKLEAHRTELYVLMLFAVVGMILMATAIDLVLLFLGVELMSVCFYILAGVMRSRLRSNESSLKYFLLGAFTTGFLLYGIALVYGATGTTNLASIAFVFPTVAGNTLFQIGALLIFSAFAFKVAAVPFHMWAPDVYEGAPTPITAFMATAAKTAAFGMVLVVFTRTLGYNGAKMNLIIAAVAAASMIVGNITAIAQTNIKRMLAYSSIAHAGYMLAGIAAANRDGQMGVVFYLAAYSAMNLGAFLIVALIEKQEEGSLQFSDYAGLSKRKPALAALMAAFMFALSGIPPFGGFVGKYLVFMAAVKAGMIWLAIIGVLTSVISAYYYLRLAVVMYFQDGGEATTDRIGWRTALALTVTLFFAVQLGVYPSLLLDLATFIF